MVFMGPPSEIGAGWFRKGLRRGVERPDSALEEQPKDNARCDWDHVISMIFKTRNSFSIQILEKGAQSGSSERQLPNLRLYWRNESFANGRKQPERGRDVIYLTSICATGHRRPVANPLLFFRTFRRFPWQP
jgi:hypothetical protein